MLLYPAYPRGGDGNKMLDVRATAGYERVVKEEDTQTEHAAGKESSELDKSMKDRIEALERRVALIEEQQSSVSREESAPLNLEGFASEAETWTFHSTVENSKKNIGYFYDHKWESWCKVSGYVTDVAGNILTWKHIVVGFNRGCKGVYPKSECQERAENRDKFSLETTLTPQIDHWSGWVEFRSDAGVARFNWKSKKCG